MTNKFNMAIFDKKTQSNNGEWLHILHPETGDPVYLEEDKDGNQSLPMRVRLLGQHSDEFEKLKAKFSRLSRKRSNIKLSDKEELAKATNSVCEMYAKMTTEIENCPAVEEHSFESLVSLYKNYIAIRVQVGDFISNDLNFMKS